MKRSDRRRAGVARFVLAAAMIPTGLLRPGSIADAPSMVMSPAAGIEPVSLPGPGPMMLPAPFSGLAQETDLSSEPDPDPSPEPSPAPSMLPSSSSSPEPGASQSVVVEASPVEDFPFVVLRPDKGAPQGVVEMEGAGWDPSNRVSVFFASDDPTPSFQVTANGEGRFRLCAPVPVRPVGSYTLKVCQHCGSSGEVTTNAVFDIVAGSGLSGAPSRACRTIALEPEPGPGPGPGPSPSVLPVTVLPATGPKPSPTELPTRQSPRPPQPSPAPRLSVLGKQVEAAVNQEVDQIQPGHIAFNPVLEMQVSIPERVEANIQRAFSDGLTQAVKDELAKGLTGPGRPEFDKLDVGEAMTVRLEGRGAFDVHNITPENQALVDDRVTSWKWDVMPKDAGTHSLILCVDVQILVPQRNALPISNCSFERLIHVKVNPVASSRSFFGNNWQWLVGGPLGTALFALLARTRQKSRRRTRPRSRPRRPQPSRGRT